MAKRKASVAVVTRTKDRELFLERAIESVHLQSYQDLVHVIISDGGTNADKIEILLDKYKDIIQGRVQLIVNDTSRGMEAASNQAIASVESEYIAIHDDDDTWHAEFLERTVKYLEANDEAGVVVKTDKVIEEVATHQIVEKRRSVWMPDVKAVNLYKQCIENQMTPITFLYRRSAYIEVGPYDESLPVTGDWDFGIRFLLKYDVGFIDPGFALAGYHHRNYVKGSTANNSFGDSHEKHRYYTNKLMNKYLRQELVEGRLGVGYIMSKLRYDQANIASMLRKVLPSKIIDRLKQRVQS